nr:MAG TPA: hypothetical protein [Caudoviricetes sp.]
MVTVWGAYMQNTCLCKESRYGLDIHVLRLQGRSLPRKPLSMRLWKNHRRCEASWNSRLQSRSAILLLQMQARRTHSFLQVPVPCRSAYTGRLRHSSTFSQHPALQNPLLGFACSSRGRNWRVSPICKNYPRLQFPCKCRSSIHNQRRSSLHPFQNSQNFSLFHGTVDPFHPVFLSIIEKLCFRHAGKRGRFRGRRSQQFI